MNGPSPAESGARPGADGGETTLGDFYGLMESTARARRAAVSALLENRPVPPKERDVLARVREALSALPGEGANRGLLVEPGLRVTADLSYEIGELDKDLTYLDQGEEALLALLERLHPGLGAESEALAARIAGAAGGRRLQALLTDRDGTVNNYCGRYRSSIQSAYNAVFLCRFARVGARHPLILTSAPLSGPGLLDVSVMPPGSFHLAASKGRECLDIAGRRHEEKAPKRQQALLDRLAGELRGLLERPENRKFGLIGSGFQVKFGQLTMARQDVSDSVPAADSRRFLDEVAGLVRDLDPEGRDLSIEDTGLDVEVVLKLAHASRDFDKGEAVRFLERSLDLALALGPVLVCGDTASDLPMIRAVAERSPAPLALLVTTDENLARELPEACADSQTVSAPDVLVTALGRAAEAGIGGTTQKEAP
ncbi:hypothetical protein dsx2_2052 [Desulfovibrio sp. X2]|uniref:hypothetical protein n=1 Tax=Desulfovibrio sp. X2 TaxID=941449 RepID=UPI000358E19B|nr:hypothetical protein [Desulfovibrio sp. X2]EPR43878.1 hypothetical protein dsx2_2052 [Desulfovibrio sp. X2]